MGLSNKLSCEAGSFSYHLNPHRISQSAVLRLYFPALEPWVAWSVSLPTCPSQLSTCKCWSTWSASCCLTLPVLQALPCHTSSLPQIPVSAPLTSLNECFFNSLVVRLLYTSTFWLFWVFFFFLTWLFFFWLCEEAKYQKVFDVIFKTDEKVHSFSKFSFWEGWEAGEQKYLRTSNLECFENMF